MYDEFDDKENESLNTGFGPANGSDPSGNPAYQPKGMPDSNHTYRPENREGFGNVYRGENQSDTETAYRQESQADSENANRGESQTDTNVYGQAPQADSGSVYPQEPQAESENVYRQEPLADSGNVYRQESQAEPDHISDQAEQPHEDRYGHQGVVQHSQEGQDQSGFYHYSYNRDQGSGPNPNSYQQTAVPGPEKPRKLHGDKKKGQLWKKFAVCAGLALVFGVVGSAAFQVTGYIGNKLAPQETQAKIETAGTVSGADTPSADKSGSESGVKTVAAVDISQVAENAMPSIVAITNKGVQEVQGLFFGQSYTQETESAGSGVIISQNDSELLIATNNHVVDAAEELSVCFTVTTSNPEDAVVKAQVKGTDPDHDLAVVAVSLSDIPDDVKAKIKVLPIGDSESLKVGQQVVAIGNALGYGQSVTVGYISALDREVTVDNMTNSLIQTDAAINFGNSGGALLNTSGELIGINSVKAASTGVEGMGYAIPMKTAEPILSDLMNRTTRSKVDENKKGYMGLTPVDVSEEARQVYNMPAGAFVYEVSEESAAQEAGIKKGDIIVKIDGISISSKQELFNRMDYYKAGETIDVVLSAAENGEYKERTVSVTLGKRPADSSSETSESQQSQDQEANPQEGQNGQGFGWDQENPYGSNGMDDFFP